MSEISNKSDTLQEKTDRTREFLDRFDTLCVQLGIKIAQACRAVGISRSLFYDLRAGKRVVSDKMLKRLGVVEREAGMAPPLIHDFERASNFREKLEVMQHASLKEQLLMTAPAGKQAIVETRVDILLSEFEPFLKDVEHLTDLVAIGETSEEFQMVLKKHGGKLKRDSLRLQSLFVRLSEVLEWIREIEESETPPEI